MSKLMDYYLLYTVLLLLLGSVFLSNARPQANRYPSFMRFVTNVTDLASEDYYDYIMPAEERRDVHLPPRSPNPVEFVGDRRVHRRSPSSPEIAEFAGDRRVRRRSRWSSF
ncbi:hypothetical protein IGI04_036937 [Brassica rapa subsp. trilocularis]|uniref:Uncharacterized protein n=1 Tax=Brassica rapa subsp. trilocularis TaxID=1813537 RepID=A0ABQ7LGU5_BRACM|nr:hypothetical protein IGI04_036937 [Brassica rapa subsp. trilocularis]